MKIAKEVQDEIEETEKHYRDLALGRTEDKSSPTGKMIEIFSEQARDFKSAYLYQTRMDFLKKGAELQLKADINTTKIFLDDLNYSTSISEIKKWLLKALRGETK